MLRALRFLALLVTGMAVVATSEVPPSSFPFDFELMTRDAAVYALGFTAPPEGERIELSVQLQLERDQTNAQVGSRSVVLAFSAAMPTAAGLERARRPELQVGQQVEGLGEVLAIASVPAGTRWQNLELLLGEAGGYLSLVRLDAPPLYVHATFNPLTAPCDEEFACGDLLIEDQTRAVR